MYKFNIVFILFFLSSICKAQTLNTQLKVVTKHWLEYQLKYNLISAAAVSVIENQETLFEHHFGISTPENSYRICSITKLFTSIALMQLYDQEKVRLHDSIFDYIPNIKIKNKFAKDGPITLSHLLTHTSGLPNISTEEMLTQGIRFVETPNEIELKFSPYSGQLGYTNLGMSIIAEITQEFFKRPWEDIIKTTILDPLGMNQTSMVTPINPVPSYSAMTRNRTREQLQAPLPSFGYINPGVSMSSNLKDLGLFAKWHLRLLNTPSDKPITEILNSSTLNWMMQPHYNKNGIKKGYGYNINNFTGHSGLCEGFRSTFNIDIATNKAYILMFNAFDADSNKFLNSLSQLWSIKNESEQNYKILQENWYGIYTSKGSIDKALIFSWLNGIAFLDLSKDKPLENIIVLNIGENIKFQNNEKNEVTGFLYGGIQFKRVESIKY